MNTYDIAIRLTDGSRKTMTVRATTANEDSFGFSAWTEEGARNYCDELIVRVKVRHEDVGRVVHNGGKIRCFKLDVLD